MRAGLYYGVNKSAHRAANAARVDAFADELTVFECDAETARHYGAIKDELRLKGRPVPENDIWIAAIAIQRGLMLATRDSHFNQIPGLKATFC